jgi:hypothetical protein
VALAAAPANAGDIVIDEIYYAPKDKTSLEEFVELYNNGTSAVDLAGWYFSEGISYRFAASTVMQPGEYLCRGRGSCHAAFALPRDPRSRPFPRQAFERRRGDRAARSAGGTRRLRRLPPRFPLAHGEQGAGLLDRAHRS